MHDTPGRHLFSAPARAFSHGCIRLDDPVHFASSILAYSTSVSEEMSYKKLSRLIGTRRESSVALPNHVSIYVTYITVRIDGPDVVLLGDVYGYDTIMMSRL
jgi:murein L,D-transpeptidase YcbB/YkuD